MFDAAAHRGSAGQSHPRFLPPSVLLRVVLAAAWLIGLPWCRTASAGSLYQCTGVSGETVYSSSKAGYRDCHRLAGIGTTASRPAHPPVRVTLSAVSGSVTTSARTVPADEVVPASLARVSGSVVSTTPAAGVPAVPQATGASIAAARSSAFSAGVPGQWNYRESRLAQSGATEPVSDASGGKILRGSVYRIERADGSVEYTNLPPSGTRKGHAVTMLFSYIATCAACDLHSPIHWGSVSLNLNAYADAIHGASQEFGVDEAFLRAIIHAESAFNPRAMSLKGAQGLMQLMPATASDMGVLDAFNSDQNIRGGARYLSLLLHDFNGNEKLAAAAYNAGPGAVQRYRGVPPYAETQVYVERVGTLRNRYASAIHPSLTAATAGERG